MTTWNDALREELLRRYSGSRRRRLRLLRLTSKRLVWYGVIHGTLIVKRVIDFLAAAVLIIILAPIFLGTMAMIRLDSRGPVFFKQYRVGKWGKVFPMWKFRSMYVDAEARRQALEAANESAHGVIFKMKRDPRITRVGRFLRKASIDELPQLWNVLVGHMSLVGPRPPLPSEVERYSLEERRRLDVTPGITCLWQVAGRSDIPFHQQVLLDVEYIESQSILLDLKILLRTIPAVLFGRGAY
ncbi:MAG: sugar transferase [Planctomycetes bacterium]|nr:sugar transferase [Planctomycetota bacterium]